MRVLAICLPICRFQSTLPREERLTNTVRISLNQIFQSTLPREERLLSASFVRRYSFISIHAPSRGATCVYWLFFHPLLQISIHAPSRGATMFTMPLKTSSQFQSTLPREERQRHLFHDFLTKDFNPRSLERSDCNIAQKICLFLYNTDNKYIIR